MPLPTWLKVLNDEVIACRRCPRLVVYREQIAREKRRAYRDCEYWGKPVPGFGDPQAAVMILGLAPGAHGSNRTGRPFTGDASGKFMYPVLYETGFANQPTATACDDGLVLTNLYITAAARCAPPDNKPLPQELANCAPYLDRELEGLKKLARDRCTGEDWLRYLFGILETPRFNQKQSTVCLRARRLVRDAKRNNTARFLSSLQPEHANR